ncbi:MFS general substrate transporter [Ophiobolus disseminans]|uniref:MFS general substrate transporter n=1 Tax=Ophiobolus disseminans TaxID=1469910 RepID=A0A6A7AI92_9PLEO|nr:MFS general substrate transporter [Ophiobolus disseminans]
MEACDFTDYRERGRLVMNWQLFDAFGIFLGFAANLIVSQTGDNRWRYEVASVILPTIVLLSLVWTIPESPRWLLKKGRYQEAFASFSALRETPLQAGAELFYANAQIQAEIALLRRKVRSLDPERNSTNTSAAENPLAASLRKREIKYIQHADNNRSSVSEPTAQPDKVATEKDKSAAVDACLPLSKRLKRAWDSLSNQKDDIDLEEYQRCAKASFYVTRVWQLFSMPRIRRATVASLVVMCGQQMCGINILQFYSTTFFHNPKLASDSLLGPGLSLGFGLANFVFTFPIYGFIDKRGRRFLLLSSYPGMVVSMFGACLSYNIDDETARLGVVVMFMFFFVFFYSWGQGPVPFAYSSEVFPLLNREAGMSFAVFVNLFGAGVLALVVPQLTRALAAYPPSDIDLKTGESRLLGIFTGLNVVSLILIFFLVPETAGATLGSDSTKGLNYISLEELNYIFNVPTRKHITYQVRVMVPWAWDMLVWKYKTNVLRRDEDRPDDAYQLYTWVQVQEVNELGQEISRRRESSSSSISSSD